MRYKQFCAAVLALVMLLSATSCGMIVITDIPPFATDFEDTDDWSAEHFRPVFSDYTKYDESTDGRAVAQKYLDELPDRDYAGSTFFITTPNTEYIAPDDTASVVSRLAVERNAKVEDLLNINIITSVADSGTMLEGMKESLLAGTYYSDLLMIPAMDVGLFQAENALINMRTIPFFDLDKPYFNRSSSDATSFGYATYAVAGDASLNPSSFPAVYMNTDILSKIGVSADAIYSSVIKGNWNWDNFLEYAEAIVEFNSYNTVTSTSTPEHFADMMFKSSGNDYIAASARKVPAIGYTPETVGGAVDSIYRIFEGLNSKISPEENTVSLFAEGKTLFMIEPLYVMQWLVNSDVKWGILPLPKGIGLEGDKGYRSLMTGDQLMFAIPANHTDTEVASIALMALNAASHGYIYDEYVEYNMTYVLRDNGSVNMLDMILDTATFDFALIYGETYPEIAEATYEVFRDWANGEVGLEGLDKKIEAAEKFIAEEFGVEEPEETAETTENNVKPTE